MALLGGKRIHYIITDSRGKGLKDMIERINTTGEVVDISIREGDSFDELVEVAISYLQGHPFDVIYLMGGACDITRKDRRSGRITYEWGNSLALENHLIASLMRADTRLKKDFPASKVVFCPLIASELTRVVNSGVATDTNQRTVEDAVWSFNTKVFKLNSNRNTVSPAIHHQVHRYCKGRRRAYYHHLRDGLHPNEELKEKWANEFVKVMAQN